MTTEIRKENQLGLLNLIVFVLSIYGLQTTFVNVTVALSKETSVLLNYIYNSICIFFFAAFCTRSYKAQDKRLFTKWRWIDASWFVVIRGDSEKQTQHQDY